MEFKFQVDEKFTKIKNLIFYIVQYYYQNKCLL